MFAYSAHIQTLLRGHKYALFSFWSSACWHIVSYPDALAELVVSKQILDERILKLAVGQQIAMVSSRLSLRAA